MKDTETTTSEQLNDSTLSIHLPEHEPLVNAQVATALLRLVRNAAKTHTKPTDQQEKT